jgi:hypothetical protein
MSAFSTGLPSNLGQSAGALQSSAGNLTGMGSFLNTAGQSTFGAGTNYYKQLLGDRATAQAAVAPAIANVNDAAAGARAGINAGYQAGTAKDINLGNVTRDQQRAVTGLYAGVQPAAAGALTSAGSSALGQGIGAFTGAGNAGYQAGQLQLGGNQQANQFGMGLGQLGTTIGGMVQKGLKGAAMAGGV